MKSTFTEVYQTLGDMKAGDVAVSKDRAHVYVCGNHYDPKTANSSLAILDMNDLFYESQERDMTTKVKILKAGDRFDFEK
jgi:hypothetical protein